MSFEDLEQAVPCVCEAEEADEDSWQQQQQLAKVICEIQRI